MHHMLGTTTNPYSKPNCNLIDNINFFRHTQYIKHFSSHYPSSKRRNINFDINSSLRLITLAESDVHR